MPGHYMLSTRKGDFRTLAFQGTQACACYPQLAGLLRTHLGEAHARLLAEPLTTPDESAVDWHASVPVRPLSAFSAEEQEAILHRLDALLGDIRALSDSLKADPDPYKQLCGTMLQLACRFPGPECLYAAVSGADTQPVLACWGMTRPGDGPVAGALPAVAAAAPLSASPDPARIVREGEIRVRPAAVSPEQPMTAAPWWKRLLWLLLGILLVLLLAAALQSFFPWLRLPLPAGCAKTPEITAPPAPSSAEIDALRAELEALKQAARYKAALCVPPKQEALPEPTPEAKPEAKPDPVPETPVPPKQDLGDLLGDLTTIPEPPKEVPKEKPRPEPKPEVKPEKPKSEAPKETPKPEPKRGDPMKLPDKDDKSMDFLSGCWNCLTGLADRSNNPIKVRFCFTGKDGQITITDRRGKRFVGPAKAEMRGGTLYIDTNDAINDATRGRFNGLRIECNPGADNAAMCFGRNKGDNSPWSARFTRD